MTETSTPAPAPSLSLTADRPVTMADDQINQQLNGQGELFPAGKTAATPKRPPNPPLDTLGSPLVQEVHRLRWEEMHTRGKPVKGKLSFHPIADIFPMMDKAEIRSLAEDIRLHGLQEPVTTFEGKILDGRNRAKACKLAGVKLRAEPFPFEGTRQQAIEFVWSRNRTRRHLTSSQIAAADARRAMRDTEYATKLKQMKAQARKKKREWANIGKGNRPDPVAQIVGQREEERHGRSTVGQRAKAAGTNPEYIRQADKLQAEAPELLDKVLAGEVTLPEATKMLKAAAATKEEIEQETPTAQPDGSETSGDANQEIRHAQQKVRDFRAYIKGLPETDAAYGIFKGAGAERYLGWWASDLRGTPRRTRTKGAAAEEDLAAISEQAKLWAHGRTWDERPFPKDLEGLARLRRLSEIIRWSLNQFLDRLDRKLGDAV